MYERNYSDTSEWINFENNVDNASIVGCQSGINYQLELDHTSVVSEVSAFGYY